MSNRAVVRLFRLFLRQTKQLEQQGLEKIEIRAPMNKDAWMSGGQHGWTQPRDAYHLSSFRSLAPWAAEGATSGSLSPEQLRAVVRRAFRHPPAGSSREEQLDRAFASLRLLAEQVHMQECSSSCTSEGVHVEVTTAYLGSQAELDPTYEEEEGQAPKQYYTYRVRVSNVGQDTVQLLARHWVIRDSHGQTLVEVPKWSKGVVGCTPLLKPGDCFEYHSGTDLPEGTGSMQGSFQMAVVNEKRPQDKWLRTFEAEVAPFRFIAPRSGSGSSG